MGRRGPAAERGGGDRRPSGEAAIGSRAGEAGYQVVDAVASSPLRTRSGSVRPALLPRDAAAMRREGSCDLGSHRSLGP
jgi:hypothetical protein